MVGRHGHLPALIAAAAVLATAVPGCHRLTEYSSTGETGVVVIRLPDLEAEDVIPGFEGGRSICSVGNENFVVASNRGRLFWGNSAERTIEHAYPIWTAFTAGYGSMAPGDGSIYIITGYGQIAQFNLSSRKVVDQFDAGPLPTDLCRAAFGPYLYVSDGQDGLVREVWLLDNEVHDQYGMPHPVLALASGRIIDRAVMCTAESASEAYRILVDSLPYPETVELSSPPVDIAAFRDTSLCCAVHPVMHGSGGATIIWYDSLGQAQTRIMSLDGSPCVICTDHVRRLFYVASFLGDGTTRIYKLDPFDMAILGSVDVDGLLRDMALHRNGEFLLALTSG